MEITDFTATGLQDDIKGPIIIDEDRKQVTRRMKDDKCMRLLAIYVSSVYQDFESFLRTDVDLVEHDIKTVLVEYISTFITFEF